MENRLNNEIVPALMQLSGIGRKSIINIISPGRNIPCDEDSIRKLLESARSKSKKIPERSGSEIREAIEKKDRIIENCNELGIRILTYLDDDFPEMLKLCDDCPSVIYFKGDISYLKNMKAVAIVGTREPSDYGERVGFNLGEAFARRGIVDVSGLALGCDTAGHRGCLNAGGKTIAVLASGLDRIYPSENTELAEKIVAEGGALLSEYPPGFENNKGTFVERDRIQAALSGAVIVVETGETGGTMHAVKFAGDYKRLVYAFDHPEKYRQLEQAAGNRMLLREGRALPLSGNDDLEKLIIRLNEDKKHYGEDGADDDNKPSAQGAKYEQLSLFDDNNAD